jgi:hypothetical protein
MRGGIEILGLDGFTLYPEVWSVSPWPSAVCKARSICSWRSHLFAGMKYQDRIAKIDTEPKMVQAKLNVLAVTG